MLVKSYLLHPAFPVLAAASADDSKPFRYLTETLHEAPNQSISYCRFSEGAEGVCAMTVKEMN